MQSLINIDLKTIWFLILVCCVKYALAALMQLYSYGLHSSTSSARTMGVIVLTQNYTKDMLKSLPITMAIEPQQISEIVL